MRRIFPETLVWVMFALPTASAVAADAGGATADWSTSLRLEAFGGGHFFSDGTNLGVAAAPERTKGAKDNAMWGLRATLGLRAWAAVEAEVFGMITPDRTYDLRADVVGYRLNLIAYVLPGNLRPFALVGAGSIEVAKTYADGNAGLVRDRDGELHVGVGVDYRFLEHLALRLDARTVQMPGKQAWSLARDFEATLGVVLVFGGRPSSAAVAEPQPAVSVPDAPVATPPAPAALAPTAPLPAAVAPMVPSPVGPVSAPAVSRATTKTSVAPPVAGAVARPTAAPPTTAVVPPRDVSTVKELLGRAREIKFDGSSSKLSLVSLPLIGQLAEALVKEPSVQLEIVAHTAASGNAPKDMALSKRRAEAVKSALVEREVPSGRLTATGRGSEEPLAPNITRSGRKLNERMELRLAGTDKP